MELKSQVKNNNNTTEYNRVPTDRRTPNNNNNTEYKRVPTDRRTPYNNTTEYKKVPTDRGTPNKKKAIFTFQVYRMLSLFE